MSMQHLTPRFPGPEAVPYQKERGLLADVLAMKPRAASLCIAIEGPSGCGKSTLSMVLRELDSDVVIVQMDDFYRPMSDVEGMSLSPEQGYKRFFDWERLREQVLIPISKSQGQIAYQIYDWPTKSLGRWETFEPKGVVIVEGVYSMRQELREYYDYTIFVNTPEAVRLARMEARNQNPSAWRERWLAAEQYYYGMESPSNFANLVLCGHAG